MIIVFSSSPKGRLSCSSPFVLENLAVSGQTDQPQKQSLESQPSFSAQKPHVREDENDSQASDPGLNGFLASFLRPAETAVRSPRSSSCGPSLKYLER